jgi:hypothetical protein
MALLCRAALLAAMVGACRPPGPAVPGLENVELDVPSICESPPVAERPPLVREFLPPAVADLVLPNIRPDDPPEVLQAGVRESIVRFDAAVAVWLDGSSRDDPNGQSAMAAFQAFVGVLASAHALEEAWLQGAEAPPADVAPLFESVYDALRLSPTLAQSFVQRVLRYFQTAATLDPAGSDLAPLLAGLGDLLEVLPARAAALHRWVALPLACDDTPGDLDSRLALAHLAEAARDAHLWDEALRCRADLARRMPDETVVFFSLAADAYRAGRPDLGDAAAQRGENLCGDPCTASGRDVASLREAAHRLAETPSPNDLDGLLAAAEAHEALGHLDEARALLADVVAGHPDDARAFLAQARLVLEESGDIVAAADLLRQAGPENRDDDYWAILSVGVAMRFFLDDMPSLVADPAAAEAQALERFATIQDALEHYAEFHPELAAAPLAVVRAVHRGLTRHAAGEDRAAVMRSEIAVLRDEALELASNGSPSADLSLLLLQVALLDPSCERAVEVLDVPPSSALSADRSFARLRVVAELWTAARCDRSERLDVARALAEALPDDDPAAAAMRMALAGDVAATGFRLDGREPYAAEMLLSSAAEDPALPEQEKSRVLLNLAVLRSGTEDDSASVQALQEVEERTIGVDKQVARLDRVALAVQAANAAPEAVTEATAAFTEVAGDASAAAGLRYHALRWLAWLALREGKAEEERAFFGQADALARTMVDDARAVDRGILVSGFSVIVGLAYIARGTLGMTGGNFGLGWGGATLAVRLLVVPP